jgi:hypothetical protein
MKKRLLLSLCVTALLNQAQNYGEVTYSHPGYHLSSGKNTSLNSLGFLMGTYDPQCSLEQYNFIIDKVNDNKDFLGLTSFSRGYMTFGDAGCNPSFGQVLDCSGISVIEINPVQVGPTGTQTTAVYAVAGANSSGIFFALLDVSGVPLLFQLYNTNNGATPQKPQIFESSSSPGEFIISAACNNNLTCMRVDANAALLWSFEYSSIFTFSKLGQVIECPYSGDITAVGWAMYSGGGPIRATDGFFLKINQNTGMVNTIRTYGHPQGACNEFYCINVANSTKGGSNGFVIGGWTDPFSGGGRSWFLKVDPNGNQIWNREVSGSLAGSIAIMGIFERQNAAGDYEYFGTGPGWFTYVYKLEEFGMPFSGGVNEFEYNSPGLNSASSCISYISSGGPSPNEGFHVFGNDDYMAPTASYLVSSYFNGITGCEWNKVNLLSSGPGPNDEFFPPLNPQAGPTPCNNSMILSWVLPTSPNFHCSSASVAGGSNARTVGITEMGDTQKELVVFPNPTNGAVAIQVQTTAKPNSTIKIHDSFGRLIQSVVIKESTSNAFNLDFGRLSVETGVYFVTLETDAGRIVEKVTYFK